MSKLNEKDTELYIHEKYIINLSAEENIFTDDVMKKIHHLSNGITDRIDFLCIQYLSDPIGVKQNSKIYLNIKIIPLLIKYGLILLISFSLIGVIFFFFKLDTKNTNQTLKIELPKKSENKVKLDENLLIALKEVIEPPVEEELSESVTPVSPEIENDSHVEISDIQKAAKEELVLLENPEDNINSEIVKNSNDVVNQQEDIEKQEELKNSKRDINWLIGQEPDKYVLQLISAIKPETIENYLSFFENKNEQIIEFTASINGTKHHILVYGLFDNSDLARAEIEKLPQKARQIKPWARTIQSISDLIK